MGERLLLTGFLVLILVGGIYILPAAGEGSKLLYEATDPAGDDFGPGSYSYPTHQVFNPHQGLFDLTYFSIESRGNSYIFTFTLGVLTDPWDSHYGFSMPLIQIYIDNERGGSTELFREGANVRLQEEHPWNKLIKISGWWIYVFSPGDRGQDVIDFTLEGQQLPWEIDGYKIEIVNKNKIVVHIKKDIIGPLAGEYLYLLLGSFDPFGLDHFRAVRNEESLWYFYDQDLKQPDKAPRVIDILLPEEKDQQELLADYGDRYAAVYPVKIVSPTAEDRILTASKRVIFFAGSFILILLIFFWRNMMQRKKPINRDAL
ncbi:MAG: glucodextranase DOMON-like domain-containing protein [Halanaerobiales bacterium]